MIKTLKNIDELKETFDELKSRVAAVEERKVDQAELTDLRELISSKGNHISLNVPSALNVYCQLLTIQSVHEHKGSAQVSSASKPAPLVLLFVPHL